jgi:uncharacterized surface protein with fasciclin (FAS1) repeats
MRSERRRVVVTLAAAIAVCVHLTAASAAGQSKDIVDVAVAAGTFKSLAAALQAADLVQTLKGPGPFTVFAPTDEAFAKIPKADLDALLKDKAKLTRVLSYHVFAGNASSADLKQLKDLSTVNGGRIKIDASKGLKVDNATVVKADVPASNGVIHVIDGVLMPK